MILVEEILNMDPKTFTETDAMYKFYWLIAFPVQGVCRFVSWYVAYIVTAY